MIRKKMIYNFQLCFFYLKNINMISIILNKLRKKKAHKIY